MIQSMAKRRTRKQKSSAKHPLTINWNDLNLEKQQKSRLIEPGVKGQKSSTKSSAFVNSSTANNAKYMEKDENLRSIKIDLAKSILISIFIIALELMLYLRWV